MISIRISRQFAMLPRTDHTLLHPCNYVSNPISVNFVDAPVHGHMILWIEAAYAVKARQMADQIPVSPALAEILLILHQP
jgi:hypothetical protein